MKYIFVFLVVLGVVVILYFGFISMISKVMPDQPSSDPLSEIKAKSQQDARMQDIRERQKQLMEDRRQRLRDMQRR